MLIAAGGHWSWAALKQCMCDIDAAVTALAHHLRVCLLGDACICVCVCADPAWNQFDRIWV